MTAAMKVHQHGKQFWNHEAGSAIIISDVLWISRKRGAYCGLRQVFEDENDLIRDSLRRLLRRYFEQNAKLKLELQQTMTASIHHFI